MIFAKNVPQGSIYNISTLRYQDINFTSMFKPYYIGTAYTIYLNAYGVEGALDDMIDNFQFRYVIIPGGTLSSSGGRLDLSSLSYEEVVNKFGIEE